MPAAAVFGAILGITSVVFDKSMPQPIGALVWGGLAGVHLLLGAALTWRRTRLVLVTAAMILSAINVAVISSVLTGYRITSLPIAWALTALGLLILPHVCMFAESRVHRREWLEWKAHMETLGPWDIFLFRHIPRLVGRAGVRA